MSRALFLLASLLACSCTHTLEVRSDAPGADVYLDGEHVGRTPLALETSTSHADVATMAVRQDGKEARFAVENKGYALEPLVAGFVVAGAALLVGTSLALGAYVTMIALLLTAPFAGAAVLPFLLGTVVVLYGGVILASLGTYAPFFAVGELGRKGPREIFVDFEAGTVVSEPAGYTSPLTGVSEGHTPLRSGRQREAR